MENEENEEEKKAIPKLTEMVDRLEKANKEAKEILARQEELAARGLLGGKTDAGVNPPQPKEETAKEYAAKVMKGEI